MSYYLPAGDSHFIGSTPLGNSGLPRVRLIGRIFHPAVLAAIFALVGCAPSGDKKSSSESGKADANGTVKEALEAPLVEIAGVRRGHARETITLNGDLRTEQEVDLTSRVTAVVSAIHAREGEGVAAGAHLVDLDATELELVERQEKLTHDDAVARTASARLDLDEAVQSADLARLTLEKCERDLSRFDQLLASSARKAFSEEEHDAKRFAVDEARIALEKAGLARERAEVQSRLADITTKRLEAAWERARMDVDHCAITSPIDGAVSFLEVRPGELVQSGTRVASVVNGRDLYTEVRVPQRRVGALAHGQEVEIRAETFPEELFAGVVDSIHPTVDAKEGTVKVRVRVTNPGQRLRPGSYVSVTIITASFDSAFLIPKRARLLESEQSYVFVVRDGVARRLQIRTGVQTVEELQLLEGPENEIREQDLLIVRGQAHLKDGTTVRTQKSESPAAAADETAATPANPESAPESKEAPASSNGRG